MNLTRLCAVAPLAAGPAAPVAAVTRVPGGRRVTARPLDPFNLPPSLHALVWPSFDHLGAA